MAATIIDFSPAASDIDQLVQSANGTYPSPSFATPQVSNVLLDRGAGQVFHTNAPDMLFCAELIVNNYFKGVLVAWENYYAATHYEIFKRNKISANPIWERIIMLAAVDLGNESKVWAPYINNVLGIPLKIPQQGYVILDTDVSVDRIYEYKVIATTFPAAQSSSVTFAQMFLYDIILNSHGKLRSVTNFQSTDTIEDISKNLYGTPDAAWVFALLNDQIPYFGAQFKSIAQVFYSQTTPTSLYSANDFNNIMDIFVESVNVFGLRATIYNLLVPLRNPNFNQSFFDAVIQSIDEGGKSFSFRAFNTRIASIFPAYGNALAGAAPPTPVTVFQYGDITDFNNFANLTQFIVQLNSIYISVIEAGQVVSPLTKQR